MTSRALSIYKRSTTWGRKWAMPKESWSRMPFKSHFNFKRCYDFKKILCALKLIWLPEVFKQESIYSNIPVLKSSGLREESWYRLVHLVYSCLLFKFFFVQMEKLRWEGQFWTVSKPASWDMISDSRISSRKISYMNLWVRLFSNWWKSIILRLEIQFNHFIGNKSWLSEIRYCLDKFLSIRYYRTTWLRKTATSYKTKATTRSHRYSLRATSDSPEISSTVLWCLPSPALGPLLFPVLFIEKVMFSTIQLTGERIEKEIMPAEWNDIGRQRVGAVMKT